MDRKEPSTLRHWKSFDIGQTFFFVRASDSWERRVNPSLEQFIDFIGAFLNTSNCIQPFDFCGLILTSGM